jgi:TonB family protein
VLKVIILSLVLIQTTPSVATQDGSWIDQMNSGRNVAGPFHRPLIVRNEYGTDDQALLAYRDQKVEMYVPDVTDDNGYLRLQELLHFGTFTTMLYMYDVATEHTTTYFLFVNTPKKTIEIHIGSPFSEAALFTFSDAPFAIGHAVLNTVKTMRHEISLRHISDEQLSSAKELPAAQVTIQVEGFDGPVYKVGNRVSEPKLIDSVEAEYSHEARSAKIEGTVVVSLIVDAKGTPQNVHVTHFLGKGLDDQAAKAVRQYRFKPAINLNTGQPVAVPISVEVRFRLY